MHMIDVFNELHVDLALPGNHDFDLGAHTLVQAIAESNFPWILVITLRAQDPLQ